MEVISRKRALYRLLFTLKARKTKMLERLSEKENKHDAQVTSITCDSEYENDYTTNLSQTELRSLITNGIYSIFLPHKQYTLSIV